MRDAVAQDANGAGRGPERRRRAVAVAQATPALADQISEAERRARRPGPGFGGDGIAHTVVEGLRLVAANAVAFTGPGALIGMMGPRGCTS